MKRTRWFLPAVWVAFFLSGSAGLIYEVVWARYLDLILGGTAYAHVMVLTAYMGGMALGAHVFGRRADTVREPLVVYSYLEMGVGLYGLLFPLLFPLISALYLILAGVIGTTGFGGVLNKGLSSVLLLAPSTFLMGGTLPLLMRALTDRPERVGRGVAGLYFINSIGAVIGALLAGFLLIPGLGTSAALTIAAAINILVGVGLLAGWRYGVLARAAEAKEDPGAAGAAGEVGTPGAAGAAGEVGTPGAAGAVGTVTGSSIPGELAGLSPERLRLSARVAVGGAGLSGLLVMMYEVAWIRMLSTILGSSTYSFTLMLAAFITGIALGSLLARWLARYARPFLFFGLSQLVIGASLLLTLPLYGRLPLGFLWLQSVVAPTESGYPIHELLKYLFCLAIMVPPTLASGAALPLATDVAARLFERVGSPVGRVYAINTLGTIAGALLGGLVLLPLVGVKHTLEIGIVLNLAVGLFVLSLHPRLPRRIVRLAAGLSAFAVLLYLTLAPAWDLRAFAAGVFRERERGGEVGAQFRQKLAQIDVLFYTEDVNGTVAVTRSRNGTSLIVNGKADASTSLGDRTTQTMLAAIPALMVPRAHRAFVIGLGSGQTVGHLLRYPIDRVEVVEISPGVVRASRYFDDMNGRPLEDERTELVTQDAKTYLLTRPEARYDLIISEPSNPWIAGIGGLFTIEYFTTLRERLEPGGVAAQWIHVYEQSDETLQCVFLTFAEVFPFVSVWGMSPTDLLLLGSAVPQRWDFGAAQGLLERPGVKADLSAIHLHDLYTILSRQLMSPLRFAEATSLGGRINTNTFPFLEYRAPKAFFIDARTDLHLSYDERTRTLRNTGLALSAFLDGHPPGPDEIAGAGRYFALTGGMDSRLRITTSAAWLEAAPDDPAAVEEGIASGVVARLAALAESARLAEAAPDDPERVRAHVELLLTSYAVLHGALWEGAPLAVELLRWLPRAIDLLPEEAYYYLYRLGQVHYDQGSYGEAAVNLNAALEKLQGRLTTMTGLRVSPSYILSYLGRVQLVEEAYREAWETFRAAWVLDPGNTIAAFWANELNPGTNSGRFVPATAILPR